MFPNVGIELLKEIIFWIKIWLNLAKGKVCCQMLNDKQNKQKYLD